MTYQAEVLADSPVGYWPLDETSGTAAVDASGNGNNGTYVAAPTLNQPGPSTAIPAAVAFDGSSQYVALSNPSALNVSSAWTLEAWVYAHLGGQRHVIADGYNNDDVQFVMGIDTSFVSAQVPPVLGGGFYSNAGTGWHLAQAASTKDAWHHLAITFDGTTIKTYIDGTLAASNTPSAVPSGYTAVAIGAYPPSVLTGSYWGGSIAQAAIYGTALSAARITVHHAAGTGATHLPTVTGTNTFNGAGDPNPWPLPPAAVTDTFTGAGTPAVSGGTPVLLPTVTVTNTFTGSDITPTGTLRRLPISRATNTFDGGGTLPIGSRDWRAVLVTATGTTVAPIPDVHFHDIVETLNDIDRAQVTVPYFSASSFPEMTPAASAIDETDPLPELELQVWRGANLMFWGPVTRPNPDAKLQAFVPEAKDPSWWLSRRHIGLLGGGAGVSAFAGGIGPPGSTAYLQNPRFGDGLDHWQMLHAVSFGEFPGFAASDPSVFHVVDSPAMPDGDPMLHCTTPLGDPNNAYQLYQDTWFEAPVTEPLRLRLSGWVLLPTDTTLWAPTTQGFGLLLAWLPYGAPLPVSYYTDLRDVAGDHIGLETPVGRLVYQHCEIEIPPASELNLGYPIVRLHMAICPPQGESWWGGLSLQGDDGAFFYATDPSTIGGILTEFATSVQFGKDTHPNITPYVQTGGGKIDRSYHYEDRTPVLSAIRDLSNEGWFDWDVLYGAGERIMGIFGPKKGSYRAAAACRIDASGGGNVADIRRSRDWEEGATVIEAQDRGKDGRHYRATARTGVAGIEEVFSAGKAAESYDLATAATERLAAKAHPETIEIDSLPGDDRLMVGVTVGDTIDVRSTKPGHRFSGRARIVRRELHPDMDTVTLICNPEAT